MMEDQIIVAVCGKPELYDSTNYFYRDKYRKDRAWRRVSEETGVADRWTGVQQRGYSAGSWCPGGRFVSQRGTADLRTGSWIDGSTAEIDRHPDAAPGISGGNLRTVPVPEECGEPRDVDVGGIFRLFTATDFTSG
ncbi:hypothetical protein ATANTOWER_022544 [Ataeniobius toweri]|uniref:MADF domain-containing protein n=1 Tax=Ataeniobius toweri TaxID=208326 RepID=A0ABU7B129_9TELE|nr:hypothetical protein [Ataeniobius toweri]